jgi:hypothetical protein
MISAELRRSINLDFRIRLTSPSGFQSLRGAGTLYKDVGVEKSIEILTKVLNSSDEKPTFKLYKSFKIEFVRK